jgi:hypothetical protein
MSEVWLQFGANEDRYAFASVFVTDPAQRGFKVCEICRLEGVL